MRMICVSISGLHGMQVLNVLPEDPELQLNLARQIIHHSLTNKVRCLTLLCLTATRLC